jgi:RNase P subunit RPR2
MNNNDYNYNNNTLFKTIWICNNCGTVMFFQDEGEAHRQETGHEHLISYNYETGKNMMETQ